MTHKINFTREALEKLAPAPEGKRDYYGDARVPGLQVQVTDTATKTFYVYKRIKGRPKRVKLGRFPDMAPAKAREQARICLGEIAAGKDPDERKRRANAEAVTLKQAFEDFLQTRPTLKTKTVYDYRRVMAVALSDWQSKRVVHISKDMVGKRHQKLGMERGESYANLTMRVLRAVLNYASGRYEDEQGRSLLPENPVKRLSDTRAWYRQRRRRTVINQPDLPAWFAAVLDLKAHDAGPMSATVADYLLLILFTGLRRQEAATLTWEDVDLPMRTLTVRDTKNQEDHTLPLSDYLHQLLSERRDRADGLYVFPGDKGNAYLIEPRNHVKRVVRTGGVAFTIHDLRRTFITVAEGLDIPAYALKRLLNHKMTNDVTAGYIVTDVHRLRGPMQQITDFLLSVAEIRPSATVIHPPTLRKT